MTNKTNSKTVNVVFEIPGGMSGSEGYDNADPTKGRVTIDPARIEAALAWMRKRATKFEVIATHVSYIGSDPVIAIVYRMKTRAAAPQRSCCALAHDMGSSRCPVCSMLAVRS